MSDLAATRKMLACPAPTGGQHLYGSAGEGVVQSLQLFGVDMDTLNELQRHATNLGSSWKDIFTIAFQYMQTHGFQIFQIILSLVQKLSAGGFSLATIQAVYNEDGGKYKDIIASLLVAFGKEVPAFLT